MKAFLRSAPVVAVVGWLIWAWMVLVGRTVRWTIEGEAEARASLADECPGLVVACWHETILLMPSGWNRAIRRWPERRERAAMMISLSPDGESVARAIKHLDLDVVRGSKGNKKKANKDKGGLRAIAEAAGRLREGGYICMTPDGPRGPRRIASQGAVTLAQRSGTKVLPYAISTRPAPRLNSWDRFIVPLPFTRGAIVFGPLIDCPRDASPEALQDALQRGMDEATLRAETLAGYAVQPTQAGVRD
ncbi:lysophospholipid acyltransferase family protein [Hyphomonas sp. WL0036]|uniref:lysophospholipid acyltransferase family protein n=1 Tax=Hyphomonas sediminis TaxID=2866160 RepID=UPI001C7F0648|nr:lysophospholipid acyltransferase family protein [Hyphomonas sediminis]MBY9065335.1 lysophospholipid acyltransferase family protein [Hyphomonas sediminis]